MPRYVYETSCVHSTYEAISEMQDMAKEVTYATIRKHCEGLEEFERELHYVRRGDGLRLKNDWAVRFCKSWYMGRPCYYIEHSRIEHIWVLEKSNE